MNTAAKSITVSDQQDIAPRLSLFNPATKPPEPIPFPGARRRRRDSVLHNLPPEKQCELNDLLSKHTRRHVLEILKKPATEGGWGLKVGYTSLQSYHEHILKLNSPRYQEIARMWEICHGIAIYPAPYTILAHENLRKLFYELSLKPREDLPLFKAVANLVLKQESAQLRKDYNQQRLAILSRQGRPLSPSLSAVALLAKEEAPSGSGLVNGGRAISPISPSKPQTQTQTQTQSVSDASVVPALPGPDPDPADIDDQQLLALVEEELRAAGLWETNKHLFQQFAAKLAGPDENSVTNPPTAQPQTLEHAHVQDDLSPDSSSIALATEEALLAKEEALAGTSQDGRYTRSQSIDIALKTSTTLETTRSSAENPESEYTRSQTANPNQDRTMIRKPPSHSKSEFTNPVQGRAMSPTAPRPLESNAPRRAISPKAPSVTQSDPFAPGKSTTLWCKSSFN